MQGADFPVWTFLWDQYVPIITVNMLIAFFMAIYVYIASFTVRPPSAQNKSLRELAAGGHSGNMIYGWVST